MEVKQRIFCLGDLHGNYRAFKQVLERSGFDYNNDLLITLGDIVDGYSETYECVEELLKIKNRIDIRGNHDEWFVHWLYQGIHPASWNQGGKATYKSYWKHCKPNEALGDSYHLNPADVPRSHMRFFTEQQTFYVDDQNRLFVHGGFNRHFSISDKTFNHRDILIWDRDLIMQAMSSAARTQEEQKKHPFKTKDNFSKIFVGHTSTIYWGDNKPIKAGQVWDLDTGAGWQHKLTIMNVNTEEYWQSDLGSELYPDEKGR